MREVWRQEAGRGIVAPLLMADDLLIATTTDGNVRALDLHTGRRRWSSDADGSIRGGAVRYAGALFVATDGRSSDGGPGSGRLHAFALSSGRERWSRPIASTRHPPATAGDTIFVAAGDGVILALRAATGEPVWRRELSAPPTTSPLPHGRALLVATTADTLYRLDRATGAVRARAALPATPSTVPMVLPATAPAQEPAQAPASADGPRRPQGANTPANAPTNALANAPTDVPANAPAAGASTLLVPLHSGVLLALDPRTLTTRWEADIAAPVLAPLARARDGSVYLLTTSAELWRARPDGRDDRGEGRGGEPRVERIAAPGGAARAALAVDPEGRILIGRLDGTLLVLEADGPVVAEHTLDGSLAAPPATRHATIYVPLLRGDVVRLERSAASGEAAAPRGEAAAASIEHGTSAFARADSPAPPAAQATPLLRPLWIAKWSTLAAALGGGGYGFWAQHEAGSRYDRLDRICDETPARCGDPSDGDARRSDPELDRMERDAARLEDRAVIALIGSQAALAGAVVLFMLDMRESDSPPNILYEPPALRVTPDARGGVRLHARVRLP